MYKIILIGSVTSTEITLLNLIKHKFKVECVFGYEPDTLLNVSGYRNLSKICLDNDINYIPYKKINDISNVTLIKNLKPDIIFAVGFSQLLGHEILSIPTKGIIGFHPTVLPKGRGRAPIAWTVLEEKEAAASFFLMKKGIDDGPIFVQYKFDILPEDDALSVESKLILSIDEALNKWLPKLKKGEWNPIKQIEEYSSEYGRRGPLDGIIDWSNTAEYIDRIIKASTKPHPGAFTFYDDGKLTVFKSKIEESIKIKGVVGRILKIEKNSFLVQTGDGLIWITDLYHEWDKMPIVGSRLGYYNQHEIYKIKKELNLLKNKIDELTRNS